MPFRCGFPAFPEKIMDQLDRKILALYQNDTRRIAESIGDAVGLSAAAVQRRLKALRANGTIRNEIAVLDPAALGFPIVCIVALTMVGGPNPRRQLDRFKREMISKPEVQQCYHVTGTTDFILIVAVSNMEAFAEFSRHSFEGNERVARFETHVVLDRVKVGLALPL
jgi:Lrp/AsnC family transcriptional regulator, leucine-responsive regulatory protein